MSTFSSPTNSCELIIIGLLDVSPLLYQKLHDVEMTMCSSVHEWCNPSVSGLINSSSILRKKLHNFHVTILGSPEKSSRAMFVREINTSSLLKQKLDYIELTLFSCTDKRCVPIFARLLDVVPTLHQNMNDIDMAFSSSDGQWCIILFVSLIKVCSLFQQEQNYFCPCLIDSCISSPTLSPFPAHFSFWFLFITRFRTPPSTYNARLRFPDGCRCGDGSCNCWQQHCGHQQPGDQHYHQWLVFIVATLDYTTVQAVGGNTTVGYYKYQNIRFAKVPTGDLRFAAPEWPDIETAINTGDMADADVDCKTSEDCLYLDVWAPADAAGRNLPVMVWTYGGGFTGGSKSEVTPEGLFDLSTDFVYVAYNYRVGITGLTNGPTYQHEGGTANLCVWDATQAFEWLQKYISNFGGNPDDVTAVGFSAGGSQVMFQMTRFGGRAPQLFHIMSPGYVPGAGHHHAEQFWQNVSTSLGCDGGHLDCMREVSFDDLVNASNTIVDDYTYQMQPRVDGFIIPDTYEANLHQGHFNFSGPCVISHELHEANSQAYSGVDTQEDVSTYLRIFFPGISDDAVETLLELYPEADYESAGLRFADMKQSIDLTAKDIALTHALNNQTWNAQVALGSATHGTDQNYYWYSTYTLETSNSTTTTATLSAGEAASVGAVTTTVNATIAIAMQKYLISFVLTGNPNSKWSEDKIYWPLFNESSAGKQIVFNDTFTIADDNLANAKSLFWNKALWY